MGFLDDLRKAALDIASRSYDQINPFDGGKNWNQRTPVAPQPQQRRPLPQAQGNVNAYAGAGVPARPAPAMGMGINQTVGARVPQGQSIPQVNPLQSVYDFGASLPNAAVNYGKGVGSVFVGKGSITDSAGKFATQELPKVADGAVQTLQGLARAPEQMARSTTGLLFSPSNQDQLTSNKFLGIPGSEGIAKVVYGDSPIQTYQKSANDMYEAAKQSRSGWIQAAAPLAQFAAPILAAGDATALGGVTATSTAATKVAAPVVKQGLKDAQESLQAPALHAAEQASKLPRVNVLNDNEAFTLGDYGSYLNKSHLTDTTNPNTVQAINQLQMQARNAAKTAGIDITSGSRAEIQGRIADYLDRRDAFNNAYKTVNEGGFIGGPSAKGFKEAQSKGLVFDGVDGKPRFEVDDSGARINTPKQLPFIASKEFRQADKDVRLAQKAYSKVDPDTPEGQIALENFGKAYARKLDTPKEGTHKLRDVLKHDELYRQYADVGDTKVIFKKLNNGDAGSAHGDTITINTNLSKQEQLSTLLHETQHIIQEKEGFAHGGNPAAMTGKNIFTADELNEWSELFTKEKFGHSMTAAETARLAELSKKQSQTSAYRHLAGEAEARAVQARMNMKPEERYLTNDPIINPKTGESLSQSIQKLQGYGWSKQDIEKYRKSILAGAPQKVADKNVLDSLNPTGGLHVDYTPSIRAKQQIADNLTTLDTTLGGSPDDLVTIYRGAPKNQKQIAPGDFVTLDKNAARQYAGDGNVLELKVRKGDLLDDLESPNKGEETLYRPGADKQPRVSLKSEATRQFNPRSTFYDSLDVPKKDLIIRNGDGVAMSINPNSAPNRLTQGAKQGRQNLSPEVMSQVQGEHVIRNTKNLQEQAVNAADARGIDKTISDAYNALNTNHIGDSEVALAHQAIERADAAGRFEDAINIHDMLSEHLTKNGQTIQAASLLYRLSPQGMFYKGMRDLKKAGSEISPELQQNMQSLTEQIKKATDPSVKQQLTATFHKLVADNLPQSTAKNLISVWKAGLLSGAKTQGGNFVSNGTFGALKKVSDIPATAIDMGISAFTKNRTKALTMGGTVDGAKQGFKSGYDTMKTGIDARNINGNKYELHGEINFKNPVIQKVFGTPSNLVFRSMSAADQPFYYSAFQNNLHELAKVDGINKGLSGSQLDAHVSQLVNNPTTTIAERAKAAAEKAVLGQDNKLASWISRPTGSAAADAAKGVLVPFAKVPANFINRTLDFSPVGLGKGAFKAVKDRMDGKPFDQRALVEAVGEGATGTGLIVLGAALAKDNLISGQYPQNDQKEAQRWKAEGITPNSIKIGNKWYSLNYLGPVGLLFAAGKDFQDAQNKGDNKLAASVAATAGAGKSLTGQSFLSGFSGFSNAIQDPQRSASSFVNSQAGSVIPSWMNDVANLFDEKQRETNNPLDAIASRTPGARNTLPIKQDVYGNDLNQRTDPLNQWLNPLKPSDNISSPTLAEVNRLHTVDPNNKLLQVTPTPLDKAISFGGTGIDGKAVPAVKLNDQQRHDLQNRVGQATQEAWGQLIKTPEYQALSDTDKASALNRVSEKVAEAEKARFGMSQSLGQFAQDFGGKAGKLSADAKTFLTGQPNIAKYAKANNGSSSSSTDINDKLDGNYKDILTKYDSLDDAGRKKLFSSQNDAEFKYLEAKYQNDKANGAITDIQDVKRRKELGKAQVGASVSKDARDLYGLSKADLYNYITTHDGGDKLATELKSYDQALYDAGLISSLKFKTGLAPSTRTASTGSRRTSTRSSGGSTRKSSSGSGGSTRRSAGTAQEKAFAERSSADQISSTSALSKKVANAKVGSNQRAAFQNKITRKGIKAFKKADKTNVTVRRNLS